MIVEVWFPGGSVRMQVIRVVLIDATPHARRLAPEFRHQEESVTAPDSGFSRDRQEEFP